MYGLDPLFLNLIISFQIEPHPTGSKLSTLITTFGQSNTHLATKEKVENKSLAAWFVSNCNSKSGRGKAVKELKQ